MNISVHFLGFQRALTQAESILVPLVEEMRVADVLSYIGERFPQLALQEEKVFVTVNDKVCLQDTVLQSNDAISIVPHIGGG